MKTLKYISIIIIFLIIIIFVNNIKVEALSKNGSSGLEVQEIQTKLKEKGFFTGEIDGEYGPKTEEAVKKFQESVGLENDGIAGEETLKALGAKTLESMIAEIESSNISDVTLLAKIIHGEARGESYEGQVGVGAVILNRVESNEFPNTLASVIYQNGAFDAVNDGQINLEPNDTSIKAAQDAINGFDPTFGALYYFNPNTSTDSWVWSREQTVTIGNHLFAR